MHISESETNLQFPNTIYVNMYLNKELVEHLIRSELGLNADKPNKP